LPLLLTGSRYIYDLYYEKEAISKELYDFLLVALLLPLGNQVGIGILVLEQEII
jgi:hypothetical protein